MPLPAFTSGFMTRQRGCCRQDALPQLPSFFEILTAMALLYFAEAEVELAVLEVGMGGRLDATNIVDPLLSVITDISLDHTEWLGSTIAAITREKAGILRRGGTLITLPQHPEANQVLGEVAAELGVRGVNAAAYMPPAGADASALFALRRWARGSRWSRRWPARISSAISRWPLPRRWSWPPRTAFPSRRRPLPTGIRQTRWPGRLERIEQSGGVDWILDVAHNPAGAWALAGRAERLLGEARRRGRSSSVACGTSQWRRWRRFSFRSSSR